jgi:hypothetical protein
MSPDTVVRLQYKIGLECLLYTSYGQWTQSAITAHGDFLPLEPNDDRIPLTDCGEVLCLMVVEMRGTDMRYSFTSPEITFWASQ